MLEILGKIGFDWQVALANLVSFLIIFWLLKRFFWKGIKKSIDDRKEKIAKGLESARLAATDRQMAEQLREETVAEAKQEANVIVAEANSKGKEIVEEAKTQAGDERTSILKRAEVDAEQAHKKMQADFKGEAAELVVAATESLLKEGMDKAKNEDLIKKTIEKLA
jgi:F-type H+-transporting ATPase subunit b